MIGRIEVGDKKMKMKKTLLTLLISALALVAQAQCVIDGTPYVGPGTKTTTAKACAVKTRSLDTNTPANLNIGVDSATSVYIGHGIANSRTGSYLSMGSSSNAIGYYNLGSSADSKLNFGIGNFTFTGGGQTILTGSNSLLSTPRDFECQSLGYFRTARGTTGQRPGSPDYGMFRYNTTTSWYESYINSGWDKYVFESQSQILTNKTLMSPVITDNSAVNAITPSNRQLLYNDGFSPTVALDWGDISKGLGINSLSSPKYAYFKTDLLTGNKTLFFPNISGSYDTVITATSTNLLTNKKISGSANDITNIGNSSLTNHTITINGDPVDLGGSVTVTADLPNALTSGTGLQFNTGTTFDGSAAKTISIDATVATLSGTQVLTNKTISGSSNTFSNIGNSSLSNSTISGVALGGNLFSLTPGTGLLGSAYNGSAAVPWRINKSVIDTLGTIASGTWQGTAINDTYISTPYIKANGTRSLTARWNVGTKSIYNIDTTFTNVIGVGGTPTAPLYANSTGKNTGLTNYYTATPQGETGYIESQTITQSSSAGTGTDFTPATTIIGIKFTSGVNNFFTQGISLRIKKTGTLTALSNVTVNLYSNSGSVPSTTTTSGGFIYASQVTTSYQELTTILQGGNFLANTTYWLVITRTESGGGNFILDSQVGTGTTFSGNTLAACSTETNVNLFYKLFERNNYPLHLVANNTHGLVSVSATGVGVMGLSTGHIAGYFQSVADHAVVGTSSAGTGIKGISTDSYGGNFTSTNYYALSASSTGNDGAYLISNTFNGVRAQTGGTSWSAGYFDNTVGFLATFTVGTSQYTQRVRSTSNTFQLYQQSAHTGGTSTGLLWTAGAHTGQASGVEIPDWDINIGRTVTWSTTVPATQRWVRIRQPTMSCASSSTSTLSATFTIDGPPLAAGSAAITNPYSINVASGNSYHDGKLVLGQTITTGGTTGNQTINKPTGTVNIAAAGTTVTVTNSLVTTSSIVYAVIRTNDATATGIKNIVPASGSFVITLNAAATAEVSIGFIVFN